MRTAWFLSLVAMLGLAEQANAQSIFIPVPPPPIFLGDVVADIHIEEIERGEAGRATSFSPNVGDQGQMRSFTYRSSPARTQQNLRNFLARTSDPAARASLGEALAAQPTLIDDISDAVRAYGFDPHNVADAYAVWWINVWGTSQKRNIEPDAATVAAVKAQVYAAFASAPDFVTTSDAERQETAEALLLQAAMLGSAFEQWKNDPKMLGQLAEAARDSARASYNLDLTKMTLTPDGFVPRKGADASEAADGDETALAATDGGNTTGIALAAGAGLGITLLGGFALMRRG